MEWLRIINPYIQTVLLLWIAIEVQDLVAMKKGKILRDSAAKMGL